MTIPYERTRAIVETKKFLEKLAAPTPTPLDPAALQRIAASLLRHYPRLFEIELAHKALPDWFGPVPPFQRLHAKTAINELGLDKLGAHD